MLRYLTSGESHGISMAAIVEGIPAGLSINKSDINKELARRRFGYGRGKRMKVESDRVEILSGLRSNKTIASPITLLVNNMDHSIDYLFPVLEPRPGHADLSGVLKYNLKDARDVLERASARETVSRVTVGAMAKILLLEFNIKITSHVTAIGPVEAKETALNFNQLVALSEKSPVRCVDKKVSERMCEEIDRVGREGDTLGGIFEVVVTGAPVGLGSYAQWDRRMDAILAKSIMSIPAIKGVSFGIGFEAARIRGSAVHDEIFYDKKKGFYRKTNNAGGIEGGMTNGEDIVIRAAMKPIATLRKALASVNIRNKKAVKGAVERADVCAVPAAGVIAESMVAIDIANAMTEKFGSDSIVEMKRNYEGYIEQVNRF